MGISKNDVETLHNKVFSQFSKDKLAEIDSAIMDIDSRKLDVIIQDAKSSITRSELPQARAATDEKSIVKEAVRKTLVSIFLATAFSSVVRDLVYAFQGEVADLLPRLTEERVIGALAVSYATLMTCLAIQYRKKLLEKQAIRVVDKTELPKNVRTLPQSTNVLEADFDEVPEKNRRLNSSLLVKIAKRLM